LGAARESNEYSGLHLDSPGSTTPLDISCSINVLYYNLHVYK